MGRFRAAASVTVSLRYLFGLERKEGGIKWTLYLIYLSLLRNSAATSNGNQREDSLLFYTSLLRPSLLQYYTLLISHTEIDSVSVIVSRQILMRCVFKIVDIR